MKDTTAQFEGIFLHVNISAIGDARPLLPASDEIDDFHLIAGPECYAVPLRFRHDFAIYLDGNTPAAQFQAFDNREQTRVAIDRERLAI
jgi:hypothetical protein